VTGILITATWVASDVELPDGVAGLRQALAVQLPERWELLDAGFDFYVDADGSFSGAPENRLATALARDLGWSNQWTRLYGPVLFLTHPHRAAVGILGSLTPPQTLRLWALIEEHQALAAAAGERLVDPDCAAGKHRSCVAGPCECPCHAPQRALAERGMTRARSVPMTARRLVSIVAAAAELGVSTKTIRRRIADGSLTAYRIGPRVIRVDLAEMESLLRPVGRIPPPAGPPAEDAPPPPRSRS
jgi:excisionase family DNA binding protein